MLGLDAPAENYLRVQPTRAQDNIQYTAIFLICPTLVTTKCDWAVTARMPSEEECVLETPNVPETRPEGDRNV
jgi:hypothetical protein